MKLALSTIHQTYTCPGISCPMNSISTIYKRREKLNNIHVMYIKINNIETREGMVQPR
jgi:hypothetical protein